MIHPSHHKVAMWLKLELVVGLGGNRATADQ